MIAGRLDDRSRAARLTRVEPTIRPTADEQIRGLANGVLSASGLPDPNFPEQPVCPSLQPHRVNGTMPSTLANARSANPSGSGPIPRPLRAAGRRGADAIGTSGAPARLPSPRREHRRPRARTEAAKALSSCGLHAPARRRKRSWRRSVGKIRCSGMRIVIVTRAYWPALGGQENYLRHVATGLADRHHVTVLAQTNSSISGIQGRLAGLVRHYPEFSPYEDGNVSVRQLRVPKSRRAWLGPAMLTVVRPFSRYAFTQPARSALARLYSGAVGPLLRRELADADVVHMWGGTSLVGRR